MPNERPKPLAEALRSFLDQQGLAKRVGQADRARGLAARRWARRWPPLRAPSR